MARKPRIHCPGGVYHVMLRGNSGQDIFFADADRNYLYLLLQETASRYNYRVHAFCLMNNHLHLAVQISEIPLSKIIQNLSFRYTRHINRQQRQVGHLFQGRYKAVLVDKNTYLLELVRYIHLNPVRAGLVDSPEKYPFSSHNVYLGNDLLSWLHTDWVLSQFAKNLSSARSVYEDFVKKNNCRNKEQIFYGSRVDSRILGNDDFIEKTLAKLDKDSQKKPTLNRVIKTICKEYKIKEQQLTSKSRNRQMSECRLVIGWLAMETQSATLVEVAKRFKSRYNDF